MSIEIERLRIEHLTAVRTLRQSQNGDQWPDELSDSYYRWRYPSRKDSETLLAFDGDRCVAMLDSTSHMYRYRGDIIRVREPCEWLCLPEYRPQGLGLRLMRMFMQEPEPMFAMAGTWMTQDILPLMGWQKLPDTTNYSLPLKSGALVESLLGRLLMPPGQLRTRLAHTVSVPVWRRRSVAPAGVSMIAELPKGDPLPNLEACGDYALACMCSQWESGWLADAPPDMGKFIWLVAYIDDKPIGLTINRLFNRKGVLEGNLLHIQSASRSAEVYEWLVTETSKFLAGNGVAKIICRASCPTYASTLKRIGFVERSRTPAFWWGKDGTSLSGPLHLTMWRGDEAIRPYPS